MDYQSVYREEQKRLQETLEEVEKQLAGIGPKYYGDDFVEQVLDAKREEDRRRLEMISSEPYFGRMDFKENGQEEPVAYYIGKRGMERSDTSEPYIIDWRAPIASLFYSFTGGESSVQYEAPECIVEGYVHLKRNLVIRDRTLQRVVDTYVRGGENLGVSDEFLLYRLGESKDNRLRDIVSTIQAEQDRIIRAPRHSVLIIQGAAGSGKTTVALHRLAYLLYRYREELRPERMIIFAPNAMFLDYISEVLPELGVGNIRQTTFVDWALDLLEYQISLVDEREEVAKWFSPGADITNSDHLVPGRFKGSLNFMGWVNKCLQRYQASFLPKSDFEPWEGKRLSSQTIRDWFEREYGHYPLAARRDRLVARINRWLEMELNGISDEKDRKLIAKSAKRRLQAYLKKIPEPNPVILYKLLFGLPKRPDWMVDEWISEIPKLIWERTRTNLKSGLVDYEDLAPLLWIRKTFQGTRGEEFEHVVVDEAQDASPFQIALLSEHMRNPSMTILGDLAQGIYEFRGIRRWEEVESLFDVEKTSFHRLVQSYRSTMEIIQFANGILKYTDTGLTPAQPVFRSGDPVTVARVESEEERQNYIESFVNDCQKIGMRTIALIGRTSEECRNLHQSLTASGIEADLLEESGTRYRGGISVAPVHLIKGLEFDAVLIVDVDATRYTLSPQDAKLLYVGCTRALHRLRLIYSGEISPLLKVSE
jgi:DNA helicase-2/ATP-dependent DNA helicase PcrA